MHLTLWDGAAPDDAGSEYECCTCPRPASACCAMAVIGRRRRGPRANADSATSRIEKAPAREVAVLTGGYAVRKARR